MKTILNEIRNLVSDFFRGNYFYLTYLLPVKKNKVVFSNYYGKGFGDNGKYIIEEINNQNLNVDIVWLVKGNFKTEVPLNVRVVKYGSLKGLLELATAKVWIDNCRKSFAPPKKSNQYYIQTWHGSISLKMIEADVSSKLTNRYVHIGKRDSKWADLMISNSNFSDIMYRNSFWYSGEIKKIGTPRCDGFLSQHRQTDEMKKDLKTKLGIPIHHKTLLYAPTFRNSHSLNIYDLDYVNLIKALKKRFGDEWTILIRLHPNLSSSNLKLDSNENIINVSGYDDLYELFNISDVLITDYSSTMFEYSLTKKPVFIYASDIKNYTSERDFYFNLQELPFSIAKGNNEISDIIMEFDTEDYSRKVEDFIREHEIVEDGMASRRLVSIIVSQINR